MIRKLVIAATLSIFALGTAGCNTVAGAGEDIESVARDVDEAT